MKRSIRELNISDVSPSNKRQKISHTCSDEEESDELENVQKNLPVNPFQVKKVTVGERNNIKTKERASGFYGLLANKKKKTNQNDQQDSFILNPTSKPIEKERTKTVYPRDISLKSTIRVLSPVDISWFSSLFTDTNITDECLQFRQATSYFSFPGSQIIPNEFQQLYTRHIDSKQISPVTEYFEGIKTSWKEAFTSAYINLKRNKENKRVYCQFEKYCLVLESLPGQETETNQQDSVIAMISPSSKALRWELKQNEVEYQLPYDSKGGIAYYDSLEPDQVGQLSREKYEQTEISQILVNGDQNVFKLVEILMAKFEREYLNISFQIPRISSSFSFDHAKYERIALTASGNLTRTIKTGTKTLYRIELQGEILPENLYRIYKVLQLHCPSNDEEPCEIMLTTTEATKTFNIPMGNSRESATEKFSCVASESFFLSQITLFSSGNQFLLDHK